VIVNVDFYRDAFGHGVTLWAASGFEFVWVSKFVMCRVFLVLVPSTLKKYGTPQHPKDLIEAPRSLLSTTGYFERYVAVILTWIILQNQNLKAYCAGERMGTLYVAVVLAGKRGGIKSSLDIAGDLLAGRVVPLMPDYKVDVGELWLVCPSRQSDSHQRFAYYGICLGSEQPRCCHSWWENGFLDKSILED